MPPTDDRAHARGVVPGEPARASSVGDGGVPEAGGVDLQPDVERIHRAILREPRDPVEGREPLPWYFVAAIAFALFIGGWYLGRYGGEFGTQSHIALGGREGGIAAAAAGQSAAATGDPVAAGGAVYDKNCEVCHQPAGQGVPGVFPPLVGSEWVTGDPETLARILLHGLQGPIEVAGAMYNGAMPAWKDVLTDEEIAAVGTYVRQMESNDAPALPPETVSAVREAEASRTTPWSADELRQAAAAGPAVATETSGSGQQ